MDLNNNLNDNNSEWLKEKQKIADSNKKISSSPLKVLPISNEVCCGYPARLTTNDGNKTQRCPNCGWTNKKWYEFYK